MKNFKKAFALLLSLALTLSVFSVNVFADDVNGKSGTSLTWELTDGTLTISGTGNMANYDRDYGPSAPWDLYREDIHTVVIEDGVTSIGDYAFSDLSALTNVSISNTVKSIGNDAFLYCDQIKTIDIPDSVTSIGNEAFLRCGELSSVKLSEALIYIGDQAFYCCEKLSSIRIPDSVQQLGNEAFYRCSGLSSVTFGSSLAYIGESAFYNCNLLETVNLPQSICYIGSDAFRFTAYYNNDDNWEDGVLYNGKYLVSADYHDSDEAKIKAGTTLIASYAFYWCSITTVTIPDSVKFIGEGAFSDCDNLTSVTIPSSVNYIDNFAFINCFNLMSVTVPSSVIYVGAYSFGFDQEGNKIEGFTLKGEKGSAAEQYAKEYDVEFIALGDDSAKDDFYLDTEALTMPNLVAETTAESIISALANSNISATITDRNGATLESSALVGTGCKVITEDGEFTVIVKGDVDGSGEVDAADYLKVKGSLLGQATLTDEFAIAADADGDKDLAATDYLKIKAFFLGTFDLFE